ncbi:MULTISPECIES: GNAT family N-acetyltransferase [unclassified Streptomyces]
MREEAPADGPGARVERTGGVVRQVGAGDDAWNGIIWSDLTDATADAAIAAQVAYFSSLGREFEWKLYSHDLPTDLAGRLSAAGGTPEPAEALMIAESAALTAEPELPDGVRLLPVTDEAGLDLMVEVHEKAFGEDHPQLRARLRTQLAEAPKTLEAVVVLADGAPVSASRMELPPGTDFAGLWGGGTVREWRGRGLYRAQVAYRARLAAARGYRYLQVDALDTSRPILQRLGFTALGTTTPYIFKP